MGISKHLKTGDACPTFQDNGKLKLLSMRFCPYAQRAILVLDAKKIPYETVYINLTDKPEWLTQYSPLGKVPALQLTNEKGSPWIFESLIIADYLDEKYPENQLYPTDLLTKTTDRLWIEHFANLTSAFYRAVFGESEKATKAAKEMAEGLDKFEEELAKRGTIFYGGGETPGMLDLMIWPWCERIEVFKYLKSDLYNMDKSRYPKLMEWRTSMSNNSAVKLSLLSGDIHAKYIEGRMTGSPDYDMLL